MIYRRVIMRRLRQAIWFTHEFVLLPALYTALICVTVYQPWYIALLFWTIFVKIDKLPCPWMDLVDRLKQLETS